MAEEAARASRPADAAARIKDGALRPSGLLLEAQTALGSAIDRHAVSKVGLPPPIVDLLVRLALAPDNQLRGIDISRQLLINPSRTSRLLDRAEARGVVARLPDPNDRRAQRITLTEDGRRIVESFFPLLLEVLDHTVFDIFNARELETLTRLLKRLRDTAHLVAQSDAPGVERLMERHQE